MVLLSFLLLSACQPAEKAEEAPAATRPNIIFLLTDDQRDNTFSGMGHPTLKTPNVDKLLSQSVRFSNTYVASPVCSPSRVSYMTGMHERLHGIGFSSSYQLTEEEWEKTYPAIMRKNGYYTGFIGKFGLEYYTFRGEADKKFDFWYGHDGWTKFFPKDHDEGATKPYHQAKNDIITPIMGEGIRQFLDSTSNEKPFCLSVSLNVPHGSQTTSMYMGYENWHAMERPANENPQLKGHPIYDTLFRETSLAIPPETATDPYRFIPQNIMDHEEGRNKTYDYDYEVETNREHHIRYYQTITGVDKLVGELMAELEQRGLAENTIIVYGSDHGLIMGEYGMGGKSLLYDLSAKIPCFIYDPRLPEAQQGKTVDALVSSLDIPVTFLDFAGLEAPEEMEGRSLVPLMNGNAENWRDELYLEILFTLRDNPVCEGIRSGDWKYIRMYKVENPYTEKDLDFSGKKPDFEQLFNLKDDPEEMNNLIADYEGSELLQELREKTATHWEEMNKKREAYKQSHSVMGR